MRLSFATNYSFKHNDILDLTNKLHKVKKGFNGDIFVAVESVYSMDGDQAPLVKLAELAKQHGLILVVDEAHAVGVFGGRGEGLVQALGLEALVAVRIVTFGKALGCHGAAVLCPELIKEYLINFSRSFIYSTALSPASTNIIKHAYSFMKSTKHINILQEKIKYFKSGATARDIHGLMNSASAVQCIVKSGNSYAKECSETLQNQGFDVRPILSPTVSIGKERLRICIHAFNSELEIDNLLDNLLKFNSIKN
jgi:8-amino-7-oxononanoate synthase